MVPPSQQRCYCRKRNVPLKSECKAASAPDLFWQHAVRTVFTSVSRNKSPYTQYMIDNCAFLVTCSETHVLMPVPTRYTSQLTAQQDVADWPSSTKLRGLHGEADWNEDRQTRGGVTRPWSLAWTCGRVRWSTTTRLERERERERDRERAAVCSQEHSYQSVL